MGITFKFPTNVELEMMTREYVAKRERFIGQQIIPLKETMAQKVQWDELDNERGMTVPHQMDADPKVSKRPGSKLREYTPMFFKEKELIKESELLNARAFGTLGGMINIEDLVLERLRARIDKDFIRCEWLIWKMLQGGFTINENDVAVSETFDVQTYDPLVEWDTPATAKPLADIEAVGLLLRGKGATASGAKIYVNRETLNNILAVTNQSDIAAFRNANFVNVNYALGDLNKIYEARGLPMFELYDEGYINANGDFETFIGDGKAILVGKREAGQGHGAFMLTPSLHKQSNGMPAGGFFSMIEVNDKVTNSGVVSLNDLGAAANPKIGVTTGFYGGPTLFYPKSIVVINAYN
jgi:hypothetical protein